MWPTCLDLSCAVEMHGCQHGLSSPPPGADAMGDTITGSDGKEIQADGLRGDANKDVEQRNGAAERSVINKYARLREAVARMGLERAWEMTPLLRVSEVAIQNNSAISYLLRVDLSS